MSARERRVVDQLTLTIEGHALHGRQQLAAVHAVIESTASAFIANTT
jgi:hypothetical protein